MQDAATGIGESHKGKSGASQAQPPFQFVNANPQSESEKEDARLLVRANASKFHWRQVNKACGGFGTSTARSLLQRSQKAETAHNSSAEIIAALKSDNSCAQLDECDDVNVDDDQARDGALVASRRRSTTVTRVIDLLPVSTINPLDRLGTGVVDPFEVYPSELPKQVVSITLDQIAQFLQQLLPPEKGSLQSSAANAWFEKCVSQRGLFHAFLFCQFARNRATKALTAWRESPELLSCHLEAVREINKKFSNASTACDDENILAVGALAYNGPVRTGIPSRSPCQGPLKALQVLDIYGGLLGTVPMHLEGLAKMVSIRGGLENIKLPGLAQQISYGDIITASQNLTKPLLPYVSMNANIAATLSAVRRQTHPLCSLGTGFMALHGILSPDQVLHLYPVLCRLCDYTLAVHDYVEGTSGAQSLAVIVDERNFVQHSLMSLNHHEEMDGVEQEYSLYELCRLAAIIYDLIVVFPLHVTTAPFAKLGLQVKEQMSQSTVHARWNEAPQLMLWITVMAAIASVGLSERSWFVSILDRLIGRLKMNSWAEMKEHLQRFLWYGSTSDADGVDLWKEIEHSNPFSV